MLRVLCLALAAVAVGASAPGPVRYTDYTEAFDAFEARTETLPSEKRIAEFRSSFDRSMPGFYTDKDPARLDRQIGKALPQVLPLWEGRSQMARQRLQGFTTKLTKFTKRVRVVWSAADMRWLGDLGDLGG